MVEAIFNGQVVGSSEYTVVVEGNYYFPPGDVNQRFLRRTRMKSLCFWQGVASYYTVEVGGVRDVKAPWTYRHPSPLARGIKDYVAFWGQVEVLDRDRTEAV